MANVYSTKFAERTLPLAQSVLLYTVPAGYVAVIRDMIAVAGGNSLTAMVGIQVFAAGDVAVWSVLHPQAVSSITYQWQGRKVMNPGDALTAIASDPNWTLEVSGYLLTLP